MKYKKQKLIIAALIFLVGLWINIYFSTNLHFLLTKQMEVLSFIPIKDCMISMATSKAHLSLFLCLQGFSFLFAVFYYIANHKPYQSELVEVTPQISTPVAAGQKQFGSAKWLTDKEKDTAFESFIIESNNDGFKPLLDANKRELEKINQDERSILNEKEQEKNSKLGELKEKQTTTKSECKHEDAQEQDDQKKYQLPKIKSGGIVIGCNKTGKSEKIYYIDEDTHTLCIGATRSGKTRTVVLQTIGTIGLAGESMILSDPKGEIYTYTYTFLKNMGYEVICVDFKNPLKSDRYNFLQPVIDAIDKNDIPKAVEATWDLTASLVPENSHNEKIWTNGEASIIASAIMAVIYDNRNGNDRRFQNMSNVYFFISEMCKTIDGTMPLLKYMKNIPTSHPARALLSISEVAPSKTRGSFYTSALTTLRLFTNPLIHSMTEKSDFDPNAIGERKQAIFIILPDEKSTYYSLASLFVNQSYMQLVKNADERGGRLKKRVNFMLEEFGNFVKIPDFANKLTVGGGRGIRFNLFLQSFMQLDEKYGKETAGTIKSNCETWIYLQADDLNTLEEISKKLGNYTVSTYSLSSSHGRYSTPSSSHSINLTHRALLTVDEVRLLSRPYSLITSRNHPAIMYSPDLSEWFFNKIFGLGDKEHNRKIREYREEIREQRQSKNEIDTWNIWEYFMEEGKSSKQNQYSQRSSMKI
ncbi:VirD4-like conjugal transfer protein, CD1115 family [Tepidibacter hydrothermalis]|uniref:Type IV secretory system conjugative DNA transfer family protein n=1 Tax=Tepidibacter hydrothermalis TaxID=3036126 RepID=A0ABY8ED43_9FIRM|nr:type IV secretory system conjugative DNA transfer family protein [Tepidibacter hydrothermalis]WFD10852.1 type IV secretory system conjugative DNA transfer family protein [Tepidibacter hydrothermalis]